jgi:hypothetical protein
MGEPAIVPVIWIAAAADRDDLIDDSRPRIKVGQVFVDGPATEPAVVFFLKHLGAESASAVPVGVARVARCGLVNRATIRPLIIVIVGGQSAGSFRICWVPGSDTCSACT